MDSDLDSEVSLIVFKTKDNFILPMSTDHTSESLLIQTLLESTDLSDPISIPTNKESLELLYDYMKHSTDNKPNISLIEKPAMKPIYEYLNDDYYIDFFPDTIKKCQFFYNLSDYFGMIDLNKIIVGHISYLLNCKYRYDKIEDHLKISSYRNLQKVFNVKKDEFVGMTKEEIEEYVNNQKKLWKTFLNHPSPEIIPDHHQDSL